MKNLTFLLITIFGIHLINAQENENFKIQQLSEFKYLVSPSDTLTLDKPFIKRFTGSINGNETQIFLSYKLAVSLEISNYSYNLTMYKKGDSSILNGSLNKVKDKIIGNITDKNDTVLYTIEYHPENFTLTLESTDKTSKFKFNEGLIYFSTYDQLLYDRRLCKENSQAVSDWSYNLAFEPANYPANYNKLFSNIKNKNLKTLKHSTKNNKDKDQSNEDFCFSAMNMKTTIPFYLDQNIFETQTFWYSYEGGAHGNYSTTYTVYDVKKAKKLSINNILDSKNKNLIAFYKQRLTKKYGDMLFSDGFDKVTLSENFYILPTGITFVHGIYSIAPYVAGEPDIFISFSELKPYLKYNLY